MRKQHPVKSGFRYSQVTIVIISADAVIPGENALLFALFSTSDVKYALFRNITKLSSRNRYPVRFEQTGNRFQSSIETFY